ncbi:class I adenylate-forming enzyme family protein [Mycolicibacterium thermoresistibile]|uniref:Long chain fatty acid-CoA ligase n=2 Tax=Mycolicibacterium thermoresistibile TaxID=1797 RepID=G7CBZ5_MYCT3|nr:class I adenylate-forming enzyme family protein [Mycolicibacterium thermoresistibile]EHI14492.1 long chain fatty acid-CoA ligase [Mycolicibacterium thermoresistibile ATCC 19527]MCV7187398.1 acyl--CoA ligase [Mycolicibacterium thermoresistibile]GAT17008.1 long chain fatty acid-CoA ligase [Mycolicibacterium thermoresistibile]SNW16611.1 long chain fatty acid-CoA ligase [Mycolicibacterium thermoresistibile]
MTHLEQAYWPADRSVPLLETTVSELLRDRADEFGERVALIGTRHGTGETERLSYAEVYAEAARVAAGLSALARPGSLVALWAPNVIEWPIIQYGAALAGVVLVALNPVLRDDELEYALRHSRAEVLLHADVSRDYPMAEVAERVCARIPGLRRVSLSETTVWRAAEPVDAAPVPHDPDTVAMLQYTSGTTGKPKGVVLNHRAIVNVARLTMETLRVPPGAVSFNPLPMFHTAGCVIATLGPLWVGGTAILAERFTPQSALEVMRAEGVQVLFYVPTVLAALLDQQRSSTQPAPRLGIIMGGASNVDPALITGAADIFGAPVFNLYGQTELAPVLTLTRPDDGPQDRLSTVGRPLPQVECKIIDPHTQQTVPVGVEGEICARGYQQFLEYLHDPHATAQALDREGFVRTGDLGRMDERGYVTVTGRLKELIIRGGENIAPAEVEAVLNALDSRVQAVVLGVPDDRYGEVVAAVLRSDDKVDAAMKCRLVQQARDRLAGYKIPVRWFTVREFPVTPTGKVQRFALRDAILRQEISEL